MSDGVPLEPRGRVVLVPATSASVGDFVGDKEIFGRHPAQPRVFLSADVTLNKIQKDL